jgi:hypothetical protein
MKSPVLNSLKSAFEMRKGVKKLNLLAGTFFLARVRVRVRV